MIGNASGHLEAAATILYTHFLSRRYARGGNGLATGAGAPFCGWCFGVSASWEGTLQPSRGWRLCVRYARGRDIL